MSVFKVTIVAYVDGNNRRVPKDHPGARKVTRKSTKWYGQLPGPGKKRIPLYRDKGLSLREFAKRLNEWEQRKVLGQSVDVSKGKWRDGCPEVGERVRVRSPWFEGVAVFRGRSHDGVMLFTSGEMTFRGVSLVWERMAAEDGEGLLARVRELEGKLGLRERVGPKRLRESAESVRPAGPEDELAPEIPLMRWEGAPNYRWKKMRKGVRYVVTCEELSAPRTMVGSVGAANRWYKERLSEDIRLEEILKDIGPADGVGSRRMAPVAVSGEGGVAMRLTAEVSKLLRKYLAERFPGKGVVQRVRIDRSMVENGYGEYPTLFVYCRRGAEEEVMQAVRDHYGAGNMKGDLVHGSFFVCATTRLIPCVEFDDWARTQVGRPLAEVEDPPEGRPIDMEYVCDGEGRFLWHAKKAAP